ncbi:DoxX family protein [Rhizobium leguminosarum]|uniref:DoxX family protein n=1 Tax=Rhizobium leguminosarum TaxID=384 RepID=UPI000FEC54C9|nr:DoxX family protein [Rhizobium leguminosarum]RWX35226.1 DoxX family protein [Rhizobium leguminosarum]
MEVKLSQIQPYLLSALRIALGLVILSFGIGKIFHFHPGPFSPPPGSLDWIAGVIELTAGGLFLVGLLTRISAFLLSGQMAFAYLLVHLPVSFYPTENDGYAAAVFSFVFLYFVAAGPGPLSIDKLTRPALRKSM